MSIVKKHYGSLSYTESKTWELSDLEPHVTLRLKQMFPKLPKSSPGPFTLKDNLDVAADLLWFSQRYPLKLNEKERRLLRKNNKRFYKEQADAEAIVLPNYEPKKRVGLKPGQALRDYQRVAVDFTEQVKSLLLVDDIGLGKTYEGLAVGLIPGALPLVVVVEPHLQEQWVKKAESFIDLKIHKVKGNTPYDLPSDVDFFIFKYTQLKPWVDILTKGWIKAIAFDEIQQLRRGTESGKGFAAKEICQRVPIKVGLTATLIYNYGIEAWNIVDILKPGLLGTKEEFRREWCSPSDNGKGIVNDPDALGAYLRESLTILRRTKADVGQEAKQHAPYIEWVEPNVKAVKDIEELAQQLAIKTLTSDFAESGRAAREFDLKMRQMTGIAKAFAVAAYTRMFVENGTPVILFGWHHEVYRIWEEELCDLNPLFYTGKQDQNEKERNKEAFINGETNLLIMSLRSGAGADGLQHRCSTVIKGEMDWSPKTHEQCVGRVDRDGQENEVFTFYVATEFGSDPEMIDTLGLKESQSRGIIDPGTSPINRQVNEDRIKKMASSFLLKRGIAVPERKSKEEMPSIEEMVAAI